MAVRPERSSAIDGFSGFYFCGRGKFWYKGDIAIGRKILYNRNMKTDVTADGNIALTSNVKERA
ncbi:MAG TPA: hypothetical protein DEO95_12615 [Ruminococcaceae bacterium]|nr:hypothetical protein [Oscillospiraceae bacterium]